MRRAPVAIALIMIAAAGLACNDAQVKHDRRWLKQLTPAPLGVDRPVTGEPRIALVRIYVDEDFRSQRVRWRQDVLEQLDDANQLLIPALGVKLEAKEILPWEVRSASRELGEMIALLEARDPGDDVAWVIGMVSSLPIVAAGFEQLGAARPLGRHVVMRGFAEQEERRQFATYLPSLSPEQREWLYEARRKHKLTALLVHEVGHTLGAPHEVDAAWVMNPGYQIGMSTLSDQSRKLMSLSLDTWLTVPHEPAAAVARRLITFVDEHPWGGWTDDDTALLRATLLQLSAAAPVAPGEARDLPVPPAAYPQFQEAERLARQGKHAEAIAALEALIAAYPSAAELRVAVCSVQLAKDGPTAPAAITACDRAIEINPGDPRPIFARIDALAAAKQLPAALALLPAAEALAGDSEPAWERIASIYQSLTMITAAEAAIAHVKAGPEHPVRSWASRLRARYGVAPTGKSKVPAADEPAYVAAVREILDLVYASKFAEAEARARAAEKRWRHSPGVLGARCDLALRSGSLGLATRLCAKAIEAWPGAAWAQYLRGVMALQRGKTAPAIVALKAAIAAEPDMGQAYRTLGKAYSLAGDRASRDALDAEYQQRFNSRLPD